MPDPLLSALLHLQRTTDPADARALLAQAALAGVDPQALREAWEDWKALRASEVTWLYTSDAMGAA